MKYKHLGFNYAAGSGGSYIQQLLIRIPLHDMTLHLINHFKTTYGELEISYPTDKTAKNINIKTTIPRNDIYLIGLVRNPYDFYVCQWARSCEFAMVGHVLFSTLRTTYTNKDDIEGFQKWLPTILDPDSTNMDGFFGGCWSWPGILQGQDGKTNIYDTYYKLMKKYNFGILGCYTYILFFEDDKLWGDSLNINGKVDKILLNNGRDTTSILDNFKEMLNDIGIEYNIGKPISGSNINPSFTIGPPYPASVSHKPYQEYYDEKLKELVFEKEHTLFEKYNFLF